MPVPPLLADLSLPIIGAPLFIISDPGLVIAQCRAGIVGSFPALNARPQSQLSSWLYGISTELEEARGRGETVAPYAVNLIVHPSNVRLAEDVAVCARFEVPLVVTSMGVPAEVVAAVHSWNGLCLHEVTSVRDARIAARSGVDGLILVCAGEGGPAGTLSPFGFVDEVRAFWDGPLVLSAGIASGRGVLAAQVMGADLAAMGSRFLATEEARAGEGYKAMLLDRRTVDLVSAAGGSGELGGATAPADRAGATLPDGMSSRTEAASAWQDGSGVARVSDSVTEVLPVALLVRRLRSEYLAARSARIRLAAAPSLAASFTDSDLPALDARAS